MTETTSYYNTHADIINEKYSHGYQIALIKSEKYSSLSLKDQNYHYLCELGNLNNNSFIADIGCGNGQFYNFLKNNPNYKNCNYVGIDCSHKQIENAKNSGDETSSSFFHLDMNQFFSHEPYFNVYYFLESIGYTTDLDTLVKSISTGLKLGGKVIIKNPIKVVHDEEIDKKYQEQFSLMQNEYGYNQDSLGMLPDRTIIEKTFLNNGFEVEKIEVPECDIMTYNNIFCSDEIFCNSHPYYVDHVSKAIPQNYTPNQYHECMIFVFKKIANAIEHTTELPYIKKVYNEGIEKSQIDPSHPNAPYMQRYNNYSKKYVSENPEQSQEVKITYDGIDLSKSFSSDSVAEDTSNSRIINLDISYDHEELSE